MKHLVNNDCLLLVGIICILSACSSESSKAGDTETDTGPGKDSSTNSDTPDDTDTDTDADAGTDRDSGMDTDSDTDTGSGTDTDSSTDTDSNTDTDSETGDTWIRSYSFEHILFPVLSSDGSLFIAATVDHGAGGTDIVVLLDFIPGQYTFGSTEDEQVIAARAALKGGLVVVGATTSSDSQEVDGLMVSIDQGGAPYAIAFGTSKGDYPESVYTTQDDGVVIAGHLGKNCTVTSGCADVQGPFLIKIWRGDMIGWSRHWTGSDIFYAVTQLENGDLFCAGTDIAVRFDAEGNPLWAKRGVCKASRAILELEDGSILISGADDNGMCIMRIKGDGSGIIWQENIGEGTLKTASVSDAASLGDGRLLAVGKEDGAGRILVLDESDGAVLSQLTYTGSKGADSLLKANNGTYLIADEAGWLLSVNSDGSISQPCAVLSLPSKRTVQDNSLSDAELVPGTWDPVVLSANAVINGASETVISVCPAE